MKLNPDIVFRKEFDGTGILLRASDGKVFYLNPVSVVIYEELQQGHGKEQILDELKKRVKKLPDTVGQDVDNFLQSLVKAELIEL